MANIVIPTITENGTTTLATKGKYCPENVDIVVDVAGGGGGVVEPLEVTSNGVYNAPEGVDGYNPVTVNVPQDGAPTDEELTLTGDCSSMFSSGSWDWFIEKYGNRMATRDVTNTSSMFHSVSVESIPFDINAKNCYDYTYLMYNSKLRSVVRISMQFDKYTSPLKLTSIIYGCKYLRDAENLFDYAEINQFLSNQLPSNNTNAGQFNSLFYNCYSLRNVPTWYNALKVNENSKYDTYYSYSAFYQAFYNCYALDEVTNLPVSDCDAATTSNMFTNAFSSCYRLQRVVFEKNSDGTPKLVKWKTQTIELNSIGYAVTVSNITGYNSGITADKQVVDDDTYQALKDDADWYTALLQYSRYNHDSAVETIDSLPDTSAYLASAGGTNTIKFKGAAGSSTDGGAINTLTAEEIAVATVKGWTVSLV